MVIEKSSIMDVFQGPKYTSGTNLQQLNTNSKLSLFKIFREATRDVLLKKLFLKVLQYWQENACVGVLF